MKWKIHSRTRKSINIKITLELDLNDSQQNYHIDMKKRMKKMPYSDKKGNEMKSQKHDAFK